MILTRIQEKLEGNYEMMTFLESKGLVPGALLKVNEILPFNETISVHIEWSGIDPGIAPGG